MQVELSDITSTSHPHQYDLGFAWKYSFTGTGRLLTALNFGVLLHFTVNYDQVAEIAYFEKTLKAGVLAEHYQFLCEYSARYDLGNPTEKSSREIWQFGLGQVGKLLRTKNNETLARQVEEQGDVQLENSQLLTTICETYKLCLAIVKVHTEQVTVERIQDSREKRPILPVVLSVEGEVVSVLVHKGFFARPLALGFPYLINPGDDLNQLAAKLSTVQVQLPLSVPESNDQYQLAKYNVVAGLANFLTEALSEGVPTALQQQYSELQEVISAFQSLHSMSSERLAYAEDLRVLSDLSSRTHNIDVCQSYPPEEVVKLACGHAFHTHCLAQYLQTQWSDVARSEKPVMRCARCAVPIVDKVLEAVEPSLLRRLQQARRDFRNLLHRK